MTIADRLVLGSVFAGDNDMYVDFVAHVNGGLPLETIATYQGNSDTGMYNSLFTLPEANSSIKLTAIAALNANPGLDRYIATLQTLQEFNVMFGTGSTFQTYAEVKPFASLFLLCATIKLLQIKNVITNHNTLVTQDSLGVSLVDYHTHKDFKTYIDTLVLCYQHELKMKTIHDKNLQW